jgi:hypothetical protein
MKLIKNNIIKILFGILIFATVSSCDEVEDTNPGGTTTEDFAGDWFISLKDTNGADLGGGDFFLHHTYNTAANDNTMWIDDEKHGYWIKCKMTINPADGTFSATNADNLLDGSKVTITNGKIEKGAGVSKAGHKVDKISFTAHFDYDPAGYNIIHTGHKRTGFLEDEY